jgi:hypothetical protein
VPETGFIGRSRDLLALQRLLRGDDTARDGGENHSDSGRLFHAVTQALQAGQMREAERIIAEYHETFKASPLPDALQAIVAGSRDRTLADDPELNFTMAAEILFLIETLEKSD